MKNLFLNYLQNKCTPEEVRHVLQLVQTPEGRAAFDELLQNTELESNAAVPTQAMWARIQAAASPYTLTDEKAPARGRRLPLWSLRLGRVAAVLLPLLVAGWWYLTREITHATTYGQTQQVTLPDGSTVLLNGNSTVRFQAHWYNSTPRQVWLTGEAFFKVVHQANHQRFVVHTRRQHTIEVLGTEFNVNDRPNTTQVVLQSGKIRLTVKQKDTNQRIIMVPGQLAEIDTTLARVKFNAVKTELFTSWQQKKLIFEGTRLAEIAILLKDTYNLNISVNDPRLLEEKITGTIPSGNVKELLNALSIALQVKYTQKENTVSFF